VKYIHICVIILLYNGVGLLKPLKIKGF
jgi:hypothetical protein